jgi:hypothetical protein
MTWEVKYPDVRVPMVGQNGNAYAIMGRVSAALRDAGVPEKEIDAYIEESQAGDYDNLLRTAMRWVDCNTIPFREGEEGWE